MKYYCTMCERELQEVITYRGDCGRLMNLETKALSKTGQCFEVYECPFCNSMSREYKSIVRELRYINIDCSLEQENALKEAIQKIKEAGL